MIVGIPKETKKDEYRVSMLPVGVEELVRAGHRVLGGRGERGAVEQSREVVALGEVSEPSYERVQRDGHSADAGRDERPGLHR